MNNRLACKVCEEADLGKYPCEVCVGQVELRRILVDEVATRQQLGVSVTENHSSNVKLILFQTFYYIFVEPS